MTTAPDTPKNVLVLYWAGRAPIKRSSMDHLYGLRQFSGQRCVYVNLWNERLPREIYDIDWDAVIFWDMWVRVFPQWCEPALERASFVADLGCPKVLVPQDEHIHGDVLEAMITDLGLTHVMSLAQPDQWPIMYPHVDFERVSFSTVLPGYLSESTLKMIDERGERISTRDLDIGYRAWKPWPSLGRHGLLKYEIGRRTSELASARNLRVDISSDAADTIFGDEWFDFLLRCRYTVGVEAGASVLDYDGSIQAETERFVREYPTATFEQVEAACFPGLDGKIHYVGLSPRHLECCATRTCQILVRGEYSGVLQPGTHYLELEPDFSNLDEVLDTLGDEDRRLSMVERARTDVVDSGLTSYEGFVDTVFGAAWGPRWRESPARGHIDERTAAALDSADHRTWANLERRARAKEFLRGLLGQDNVRRAKVVLARLSGRGD